MGPAEAERAALALDRWTWAVVRDVARRRPDLWPDLHQEAMIVLWQCALRYRPGPADLAAFAARRVRTVVVQAMVTMERPVRDGSRKGRREVSRARPGIAFDGAIARTLRTDRTPEDQAADLEEHRALHRAILALPVRERQVMQRRLLGEATWSAAGRAVGLSHEGARQLYARAERRIRKACGGG